MVIAQEDTVHVLAHHLVVVADPIQDLLLLVDQLLHVDPFLLADQDHLVLEDHVVPLMIVPQ